MGFHNAKRPASAGAENRPLKPSLGSDGGKQPSSDVRLLRQYRNASDRVETWIALGEIVANLTDRLERARGDFEHNCYWDSDAVNDAKADATALTTLLAHLRRSRP